MLDGSHGLDLQKKTLPRFFSTQRVGSDDFESDLARGAFLSSAVNEPHTALANLLKDLMAFDDWTTFLKLAFVLLLIHQT